jgi:hypothetical protein
MNSLKWCAIKINVNKNVGNCLVTFYTYQNTVLKYKKIFYNEIDLFLF